MTLIIKSALPLKSEQKYVCDIVFSEFLGFEWKHEVSELDGISIRLDNESGELYMPDMFFKGAYAKWLSKETLPLTPFRYWDVNELGSEVCLVDALVPVIYGDGYYLWDESVRELRIPIDILGSAFFMLSRYEEVVSGERDNHHRFPAIASCIFSEELLDRPIVDEYIEVLWSSMLKIWPTLKRKPRARTIRVTCDLDLPYSVNYSAKSMVKGLLDDAFHQKNLKLALRNLYTRIRALRGNFSGDPYLDAIYWMMDVNERIGNRICFYFISEKKHPLDGWYDLDEPVICELIKNIGMRGHEIGLHPSYNSYLDPDQIKNEVNALQRALQSNGIHFEAFGSRQHYLRWDSSKTSANLEAAGIVYDSTLAYADCSGFRCGTSREFTMFDFVSRRKMNIKQRPLILMETTVLENHYQGLGYTDAAMNYMLTLKKRALDIGGEFTLLWHNSSFPRDDARSMYLELIKS